MARDRSLKEGFYRQDTGTGIEVRAQGDGRANVVVSHGLPASQTPTPEWFRFHRWSRQSLLGRREAISQQPGRSDLFFVAKSGTMAGGERRLERTKVNELRLILKVCEGCGALWLRGATMNGVYCRGCAGRLAEFPAPKGRHAGGRPRSKRRTGCAAAAVAGGAR